ncbi:hypothetical protein ACLHDG_05160 [Sulfurovum sp. CS9]|uniref:hypothetical protein n=1 Tax=Sulfurovum sp. CS9 TaxID=3391146 RepID=UPI0039EA7709
MESKTWYIKIMIQSIQNRKLFSITVAYVFTLALFQLPASAEELGGTVIHVDEKNVTIETKIVEGLSPVPGDSVDLMKLLKSPDGDELGLPIGQWQVTEVNGVIVKAAPLNINSPPEINMTAVIHLSRGKKHKERKEEQKKSVWVPGSPRSPQ